MKKIVIIAIASLLYFTTGGYAQTSDFEGVITFRSDYHLNMDEAKISRFRDSFGDSLRLFIREDDYKQHYRNSKWLQEVTYIGEKNKYFMVFSLFDTTYSVDCSKPDDIYTVIVDSNDKRKFCGYTCIKLIMQGQRIKKTYYFCPDLPLKQADYSNHKMGGYDQYMKHAQSAYLYMRVENQAGIQEFIAVKVDKKDLPDKVFELLPIPVK